MPQLNPEYERWRRNTLSKYGLDPDQYDIEDDGSVVPRAATPALAPSVAAEPKRSVLGSIAKSALYNLPEAAGGVAGGAAALALAPATAGQSLWAIPLVMGGGLAGGYGAGRIKEALMPESIKSEMAQTFEERPIASTVGALGAQLPFFKPSLSNLRNAANAVLGRNLTGPNRTLGMPEISNLANVGLGATIGGGVPVAERLIAGEPIDWKQAGIGAAGGALLSEPTRLGTLASGGMFRPTVDYRKMAPRSVLEGETLKGQTSKEDFDALQAQRDLAEAGTDDRTAAKSAEEAYEDAWTKVGKELPKTFAEQNEPTVLRAMRETAVTRAFAGREEEISARFAKLNDMPRAKRDAEYTGIVKRMNRAYEKARFGDAKAKEEVAKLQDEISIRKKFEDFQQRLIELDEAERFSPWEMEGGISAEQLDEAKRALAEINRAKAALPAELAAQREASIRERFRAGQEKLRAINAERKAQAKIRAMRAADFKRAKIEEAAQTLQPEMQAGQIPPQDNLGTSRSFMRTLGKAEPRSEAEIIQDKLEGTGAKFQETADPRSQFEAEQLPPVTRSWYDFMQRHGIERLGAKGELVSEIPGAAPGKVRLGVALPREGAEALYKISRDAMWNTQPHEQLHIMLDDVLRTGKPSEKKLVHRMLREFGWDGKSDPLAFEERLVQSAGQDFVDLMLNPKSNTLRADFVSWIQQFGRSTTPKRYSRILAEWLRQGSNPWDRVTVNRIAGMPQQEEPNAIQERSPDGLAKEEQAGAVPRVDTEVRSPEGSPETAQAKAQDVTQTPEFQRWFEGSKVVDSEGKPLRVYHGTAKEITKFREQPKRGNFFTSNPKHAESYAEVKGSYGEDRTGGNIVPAYLNIKNPALFEQLPEWAQKALRSNQYEKAQRDVFEFLRAKGHDGFIWGTDYVVFRPEQIKSATGNRGTFDPNNPDIRFQETSEEALSSFKPKRTRNPFSGVVDRLRGTRNPTKVYAADKILRQDSAERQLIGKYYNPIMEQLDRLGKDATERLRSTLVAEMRSGKPNANALQGPEREAYDVIRNTLRQMAEDQRKDGQLLNTGQMRGIDPTYYPQIISPQVLTVLREGQGTPQFDRLHQDYIKHKVDAGLSAEEAESRFRGLLGSIDSIKLLESQLEYNPVTTPEGTGVPDSWLEKDIKAALGRYVRSFSRNRAIWKEFETDPKLRAAMGAKTFYAPHKGEQPIPPSVMSVEGLARNNIMGEPAFKDYLDYLGNVHNIHGPVLRGLGALINSLLLGGPMTKFTDIATTPLKMIALVPPQHQGAVIKGILDWRKGFEDSFKTGFNRRGGRMVMQDVLGATEQATAGLMKAANFVTKVTGSEQLEYLGRALAQSIGNYVGDVQRSLALQGNETAIKFLNKLGQDWRTVSREELGTRIGQIAQGKYDITNLPHWIYDSPLAPFLTMMKWSTEQLNNFINYAWKPMIEDKNMWPMIATVLSGVGGGLALEELRSEIGNRKPYTATLEELQHAEGRAGFRQELLYKMIAAAQVSATGGLVAEVGRQAFEALNGMTPQGFRYPVVSVLDDVGRRIVSAGRALQDGEELQSVLPQLLGDILTTHIQMMRIGVNQAARLLPEDAEFAGINPAERIERMDQSRDQRVYARLSGLPGEVGPRVFPEYRTMTERRFDKTKNLDEAQILGERLVQRALTALPLGEDLVRSRLRSARTIPNRVMPSYESNPERFVDYLEWIRNTQGDEAAQELLRKYTETEDLRIVKRSLIPAI